MRLLQKSISVAASEYFQEKFLQILIKISFPSLNWIKSVIKTNNTYYHKVQSSCGWTKNYLNKQILNLWFFDFYTIYNHKDCNIIKNLLDIGIFRY